MPLPLSSTSTATCAASGVRVVIVILPACSVGGLRGVGDEISSTWLICDGEHVMGGTWPKCFCTSIDFSRCRAITSVLSIPSAMIELVDLAAIEPREILQVADDLGDLLDAVLPVLDQLGELRRRCSIAERCSRCPTPARTGRASACWVAPPARSMPSSFSVSSTSCVIGGSCASTVSSLFFT